MVTDRRLGGDRFSPISPFSFSFLQTCFGFHPPLPASLPLFGSAPLPLFANRSTRELIESCRCPGFIHTQCLDENRLNLLRASNPSFDMRHRFDGTFAVQGVGVGGGVGAVVGAGPNNSNSLTHCNTCQMGYYLTPKTVGERVRFHGMLQYMKWISLALRGLTFLLAVIPVSYVVGW